jgi:hypothetical protein
MNFDFSQIGPFSIAILVVFVVYRRFRRNFGQQLLRPKRMRLRSILLIVAGCSLAPLALRSVGFLSAVLIGLALGIALALWGAARTRFVRASGQLYYVPHLYTGIAVSLLFLGRLVYRLLQMYGGAQAVHAMTGGDAGRSFASAGMVRSPLTLGLFFVLVGYYVCYYSVVLWKSTRVVAEDQSPGAPPAAQSG